MFVFFALCVLNRDILQDSGENPPEEIPERTPTPSETPSPSMTKIIKYIYPSDSNKVDTWLIVCTIIVCVIIIITIISVVVLCFRQNKGEIYAHDNKEKQQHQAGTVEIRSIYRITKA